jgi:phosphate:Na+ symporter
VRMARTASLAVNQAVEGLMKNDRKELDAARQTEDVVDNFQYEITSYLAALSGRELPDKLTVALPVLLHTVNDLERVSDHAVNIVEIAERKVDQKLSFSEEAGSEIGQLKSEVNQMLERIIVALENDDAKTATEALDNETALNRMQIEFRRSHVQRMTEGICSAETGLIFIDLVDNVEKMGDHLTNIAQSVIGGLRWDGVEAE